MRIRKGEIKINQNEILDDEGRIIDLEALELEKDQQDQFNFIIKQPKRQKTTQEIPRLSKKSDKASF